MAKLFYEADYGTVSVRADDDPSEGIEVTAEQALAIAVLRAGAALQNIAETANEIATSFTVRVRKDD